ncbi:MAG: TetR-like C-terminal domain-containing protein [Nocardioidaceae bacterium]
MGIAARLWLDWSAELAAEEVFAHQAVDPFGLHDLAGEEVPHHRRDVQRRAADNRVRAAHREGVVGDVDADAAVAVAEAYLRYAFDNPAVYEAMFTLPISPTFAQADSEPELQEGFAVLVSVMGGPSADEPTAAEVFWSALHGRIGLEAAGRMRTQDRAERIRVLASRFGNSS